MSIEKSTISAERWRDIATALADALEETGNFGPLTADARRALSEFQAAADEDDPE